LISPSLKPHTPHPTLLLFLITPPSPPSLSTLSLHDALPICPGVVDAGVPDRERTGDHWRAQLRVAHSLQERLVPLDHHSVPGLRDRKSTRLNSSHVSISYAVFCLKKKNKHTTITLIT